VLTGLGKTRSPRKTKASATTTRESEIFLGFIIRHDVVLDRLRVPKFFGSQLKLIWWLELYHPCARNSGYNWNTNLKLFNNSGCLPPSLSKLMRPMIALSLQNLSRKLVAALLHPRSLRLTLTLRIAALMTTGFGIVTLWTYWKTQDILIASHKQSLQETAKRVENDINLYREMLSVDDSINKALKNRAGNNLWIGVKQSNESLLVTEPLDPNKARMNLPLFKTLVEQLPANIPPQVYQLRGRDFIGCAGSLVVRQTSIGTLYLVYDITEDREQFYQLIQSLIGANLIALVLLIALIAYEARRLLLPLSIVSQMTKAISVDDLEEKRITLTRAPQEVQELAETFNMLLQHLSEAWQQQRTAAEQQRQFVSNVSHELRTPLTIVRGYLESVQRRGQNLTEPQKEALSIASSEADHTIRVLQDLLDLARADDGYMPYRPELLVLNDIAAEVAKVAGQVGHRDIQVEETELVPVYADAHCLKQVLVNLVENAIKYSTPDTPVKIKLEQDRQHALIRVCDRSPGIPLKHQSRIFERFYRVDEARTRSSGGTGLGLALVKTFVEGMGGTVTLESNSGDGSVFTVSLPSSSPSLLPSLPPASAV
jgi:signal transduction histidine kinase